MHLFTLLKFLPLQQKHFTDRRTDQQTDRQYNTSTRRTLRRAFTIICLLPLLPAPESALLSPGFSRSHNVCACVCVLHTICYLQSVKCRRCTPQIKVITAMLFLVKRSILILFLFIVFYIVTFMLVIVVACCLLLHFTTDLFSTVLCDSKTCSYCI